MEQVTSETSVTFPSPLLLPLPYGQHFACGKNRGNLLRLSAPRIFSAAKKKNHPIRVVLNWSRLRGSNSLPPPWQGGALPDELNLRCRQRCLLYRTAGRLSRNFLLQLSFSNKLRPGRKDPFLPKQETEQRPGAKTAGTCPSNFRLRQNDLPDG